MFVAKVSNIKGFMGSILKKDAFDSFFVREASVTTFVTFEINGILNKEFFEEAQQGRTYCLWSEIKPFVFEIVKGSKLPKYIKIVFSAQESLLNKISDTASGLFINVTFENNQITIITGSSQKVFSLDKSTEFRWDEYVKTFLQQNDIACEIEEY